MTVTIGLAGAGRRAVEVHAPAIASCPGARFGGVWARSPMTARALADKYGVPVFEHFDEMLGHCDAVAFAVPPAVQEDIAAVAARRGRAVLLERPIASDLAGAEDLAVAAACTISQVALTWRYAPAIRDFLTTEVPRTFPKGGGGRVISPAPAGASPGVRELSVLRSLGSDLVDLLDAALGKVAGVRAHGEPDGWFGLMLEHQIGRYSEASMYALPEGATRRAEVEIFGPGGAAAIDCVAAVGPDAIDTMYREFAAAVEQGAPPELDVRHGLRLQQVIEAAETDLIVGES
ncbi:Gfo/Idh/MocA family protein [Streptosporangium canum]